MNLWRRLATVLAVAFVVMAMTVDFMVFLKSNHDEETSMVERQEQQDKTALQRQRKLAYPKELSGAKPET